MKKLKDTGELVLLLALGATVLCIIIDNVNRF